MCSCLHIEVACPNQCGAKFMKKDASDHYQECPRKMFTCTECNTEFSNFLKDSHIDECLPALKKKLATAEARANEAETQLSLMQSIEGGGKFG